MSQRRPEATAQGAGPPPGLRRLPGQTYPAAGIDPKHRPLLEALADLLVEDLLRHRPEEK
jgi:hypothetical protein